MGRRWTGWAMVAVTCLVAGALIRRLAVSAEPDPALLLAGLGWILAVVGSFLVVVAAVLLALETAGLYEPRPRPFRRPSRRAEPGEAPETAAVHAAILAALEGGPGGAEELAERAGLYHVVVRRSLAALVGSGQVVERNGTYRRTGARSGPGT